MPLSESPKQEALRELGEEKCAVCSGFKKKNQSFCLACYLHLPLDMQRALWKGFGSGYEEAYQEAKDWLKQERKAAGK